MAPKTRKRRRVNPANASTRASDGDNGFVLDRSTWPGWCEIESEPAYFNVMLDEMGVKGIKTQEVFSLDDDMLAILPKPIHAMIFLFRYREYEQDKQESCCPDHLWFANQVPENACATVALLNIVNNIRDIDVGPQLQSFKDFTTDFDPMERGVAIDNFQFAKRVHNSFARELDMLTTDAALKQKNERIEKQQRLEAARSKRAAKQAEITAGRPETVGTRRSARTPKPRIMLDGSGDNEEELSAAEEGYHFIAYMPVDNEVWKLDGVDRFPSNLGSIADGSDWLAVVKPALQTRMAQYQEGQIEFSLMAVVEDPIIGARKALAENIKSTQAVEKASQGLQSDEPASLLPSETVHGVLQPLDDPSVEYGISVADIEQAELPASVAPRLEAKSLQSLTDLASDLVAQQRDMCAKIRDESEAKAADQHKAMLRRHDMRPFLTAWVKALQEKDILDTLDAMVKAQI